MRVLSDPRWRLGALVAAVVAVLIALVLVATGDDGDDVASVISATSSTSAFAITEDSTTTSTALTGAPTITTARAASGSTTPRATVRTTPLPQPTAAPPRCTAPAAGSDFAGFGATEIVIANSTGSERSCVLTADTPEQQRRGLMHQDDIDNYDGMIFRFADAQERSFWMRNTRIPLSIAFFDANGGFVSATDMAPCGDRPDCPNYSSHGASKYALEVLQGRLPNVGASPGSRLTG